VSLRSFTQAVKFMGCQLFISKFQIIYILPCTYQKTSRTSPLISESHTLSLTLSFALLRLHTHVLALALALIISISCSHSLAFCSLLLHIVYCVKFNYYLIPLIIDTSASVSTGSLRWITRLPSKFTILR
jgi:hypothetical protein